MPPDSKQDSRRAPRGAFWTRFPSLTARQHTILVTLVDLATLSAVAATVAIAWYGGSRFRLGPVRLSLTSPLRALVWTCALAATRWAFWRRVPPLPALRVRRRAAAAPANSVPLQTRIRVATRQAVHDSARAWLRLAGLSSLVVAQPLLDTVARSPEFLVAHEAGRMDILLVAAGSVLLVPTTLSVAVFLARLAGRRARVVVEDALVAGLVAAFAVQLAKHAGGQTAVTVIPLAVAGGLAAAVAYHRFAPIRAVATAASFCVVAVPGVFLATPAIRRLLTPQTGLNAPRPRYADAAVRHGAAAPVVLIILDETPLVSLLDADRAIDPERFPAFASLAHDGILFRNATTVSDFTRWAVPAILSGQYPRADLSPNASDHPETLFTLLGGTYRFEVMESFTALCPADLCPPRTTPLSTRLRMLGSDLSYVCLHLIAPPDLERHMPSLTDDWGDFGDLGVWRHQGATERLMRRPGHVKVAVADEFIDRVEQDDGQPTLFVLHTLLEHFPHLQLPSGQFNGTRADVPAFASVDAWNDDAWAVAQLYQRHLLQLRFVDAFLRRLVDRLRSAGLYRRALIVVTADHGISFEAGTQRRQFSDRTAAEIMRVPLIVKLPADDSASVPSVEIDGQHVSDRNAQTIDILPTIADALGVPLPWRVDGVSLLDPSRPEPDSKTIFYEDAVQSRKFDRHGPDLSAALRQKLRLFGAPGNDDFAPRPDRFGDLVGQPTRALHVEESGGAMDVDYLSRFREFHHAGDEIAFDLAGRFAGVQRKPRQPTYLAVAVNGVIRAVTRTWASEPEGWQAAPAPSAWREGRNDLQLFVIEGTDAQPVLRRCELRAARSNP